MSALSVLLRSVMEALQNGARASGASYTRSQTAYPAQSVSLLEYEDSGGFMMLSTLNLESLSCTPAIYCFSNGLLMPLSENARAQVGVRAFGVETKEGRPEDFK